MKFKKLVKADENFDAIKEQLIDKATHNFFGEMEKVAERYATLGLSKEQILQALSEAEVRFEEDVDMWSDFGL